MVDISSIISITLNINDQNTIKKRDQKSILKNKINYVIYKIFTLNINTCNDEK